MKFVTGVKRHEYAVHTVGKKINPGFPITSGGIQMLQRGIMYESKTGGTALKGVTPLL